MSTLLARPVSPCCGTSLEGGPVIFWCTGCRNDVHGSTIRREAGNPPPPADCSLHHNAFGAGCPWCSPRNAPTSRAAARTPIAAGRRATTTNGATS